MDKERIESYKQMLLEERENVLQDLMDSEDSAKDLLEDDLHNVHDSIDEASSTVTKTILSIMSTNNQQKILAIESALRRIVEGAFGICISCGDEIAEKRLNSIPWATQCIDCKTKKTKRR